MPGPCRRSRPRGFPVSGEAAKGWKKQRCKSPVIEKVVAPALRFYSIFNGRIPSVGRAGGGAVVRMERRDVGIYVGALSRGLPSRSFRGDTQNTNSKEQA